MTSLELQVPHHPSTLDPENHAIKGENAAADDDELSPVEEVRLTVTNTDDPTLPNRTTNNNPNHSPSSHTADRTVHGGGTAEEAVQASGAFGSGSAYAVGIVTIIKAFYQRKISFLAGWLLIITTQVN
ncbi:hypothetical protein Golob_027722 [Gossypium lobatum]|uniref:Uncharacterized protein n=1 Tax=Gossypium lobatum TaxID=34289 RepID=A0A7J8NKZ5_9ROSI|nr:hypothetical protein [Gossypium lobatum]